MITAYRAATQGRWRSEISWLRFGGLLVSAWIAGDIYVRLLAFDGLLEGESSWLRWLTGLALLYAPVTLAMLWVWRPLERSGTVAANSWLIGLVLMYHVVNQPKSPGGEYTEHLEIAIFIIGTMFYAMYAGLTWLVLWLFGRKLERF